MAVRLFSGRKSLKEIYVKLMGILMEGFDTMKFKAARALSSIGYRGELNAQAGIYSLKHGCLKS